MNDPKVLVYASPDGGPHTSVLRVEVAAVYPERGMRTECTIVLRCGQRVSVAADAEDVMQEVWPHLDGFPKT